MTYSVKNSAGTVTYNVADGAANTNAISLTFMGKGETNYGTYLNENFLWLLENFSNNSSNPPALPVQGQLWWDSTYKFLNVYDGSKWNTVYGNLATLTVNGAVSFSAVSAGTLGNVGANIIGTNVTGTLTTNAQPYITSIGILNGLSSSATITAPTLGNTGANLIGTINTNAQPYVTSVGILTGLTSSGTISAPTIGNTGANLIGIINTNAQPYVTSVGTLSSLTVSGTTNLQGTTNGATINATNLYATTIGNSGAAFSGASATLTGAVQANTYTGVAVYAVTIGNTGANLRGTIVTNAQPYITSVGTLTGLSVSGAIVPTSNASINLGGTGSQYFNNVYAVNFLGTSTTAQYADLAEKYLTDTEYPVGTVVMVGGDAEVTQHDGRAVRAVGTVSQNPAYKMNDGLEGGTYIALKGRVPVCVIGPVQKGQSLRGAPWGVAMAEEMSSAYTFAIALETVADPIQTIIEAVIL
jgi:hypothetical protein